MSAFSMQYEDYAATLGGSDFTIDFWAYVPDVTGNIYTGMTMDIQGATSTNSKLANFYIDHETKTFDTITANNEGGSLVSSASGYIGGWHHFALVYTHTGGVWKRYIDGNSGGVATYNGSGYVVSSSTWNIQFSAQSLESIRITPGTARWTANFTPPLAAHQITQDVVTKVAVQPVTLRANVKVVHKGDQGLSAYEVAVKNGYDGTETEWLASLAGNATLAEQYAAQASTSAEKARISAIGVENYAREAKTYRDETREMMDSVEPMVDEALSKISQAQETADTTKTEVEAIAAQAGTYAKETESDAREVRDLLSQTVFHKNVAADAAERARRYANGASGFYDAALAAQAAAEAAQIGAKASEENAKASEEESGKYADITVEQAIIAKDAAARATNAALHVMDKYITIGSVQPTDGTLWVDIPIAETMKRYITIDTEQPTDGSIWVEILEGV